MKESDVRLAVSHALEWHGWWADKITQDGRMYFCRHGHPVPVFPEKKGVPDLLPVHPLHRTYPIEVKAIPPNQKTFMFDQIRPEQQAYMDKWLEQGGEAYLAIGRMIKRGTKTSIERILVLPWCWIWIFKLKYEKSIPWDWEEYKKKPADWQQKKSIVDYVAQDSHFWLIKDAAKGWVFHPEHLCARPPEVEQPYFMTRSKKEEDGNNNTTN